MRRIVKKWKAFILNCFTSDKIMYASAIPTKPRRQAVEVPIHRQRDENEQYSTRRTFSNAITRKHKHRSSERYERPQHLFQEHITEVPDENEKISKISKKHLWKENLRLAKEKEEIIAKFNELEDLSVNKITKLREKVSGLQNEKLEIEAENSSLKTRVNDILKDYEEIRNQLDLCKICHGCEEFKAALEKFNSENNYLRKCKQELMEDLDMMKTVVFRLNVQLERYQEKLRKYNIVDVSSKNFNLYHIPEGGSGDEYLAQDIPQENHIGHQHLPISWGKVNSHTLGPLLEAFQDTINEKDAIINEYQREFSNFTGKYKEILSENEKLHVRLTEDDRCSAKLKEELEQLRKGLQSCKEQNDVLIKKCSMKQDKIEEILKCYEAKVEQLKRDYTVLHDQYYKSRTEVTSLNEKNKALILSQEEYKNEKKNFIPISVHTASVNECKKWYEELKIQYEKEKEKLKQSVEEQMKEIAELSSKIKSFEQDRQERDEKIKQLEKHIRKGESKYLELEQTLNETQASKTACKKQLHKAMGFAKDLVTEQEALLKALSQRQQENKVVTKIGADMASKMDNLKSQLKEVQRDALQELNTVEGKIQEQEQTIEQMKEEYEKEINRLEQVIKKQSDKAALSKIQSNLPLSPYSLFRDKLEN